jgi:hypothetical protein
MKRWFGIVTLAVALASAVATGRPQSPSGAKPNFSGLWTLNRDLSDSPQQGGSTASASGRSDDRRNGGARGRGSGIGGRTGLGKSGSTEIGGDRGERYPPAPNTLSSRNATHELQELTSEVRNPSPSLTISHADPALAVTNAHGRTRLFQTNGQKDQHQVGEATVLSTTKWDGDKLVTDYDLGNGRRMRITYSLVPGTKQLLEQVRFENGQVMRRVYDPLPPARRR